MRRFWSILLLVQFSLWLTGPLVWPDAGTKLPSCCRRDGQHHCAGMSSADSSSGTALQTVQQCPKYPRGSAIPTGSQTALEPNSQSILALVLSHAARATQTEALYRTSFSRTRQQRGPPVL